jgi:DMSO/TMAO reductase YedYZ heme-binding membrane subunit
MEGFFSFVYFLFCLIIIYYLFLIDNNKIDQLNDIFYIIISYYVNLVKFIKNYINKWRK